MTTANGKLRCPPVGGSYSIERRGHVVRVQSPADARLPAVGGNVLDVVQRDCGDEARAEAAVTRLVKELG